MADKGLLTQVGGGRSHPDPASAAGLAVCQVAMSTGDMPGSLQFYGDLFGFVNAGGNAIWGDGMTTMGAGPDGRALIWWMVSGQRLFQLEFFEFTVPTPSPVPADNPPNRLGWVRIGIEVPDTGRVLDSLQRWDLRPLGPTLGRRFAICDPFSGAVIEVIESERSDGPRILYATQSVADLGAARRLHEELLGASIEPLDDLHTADDEALWGLAGADRNGFVARYGEFRVEVVAYQTRVPDSQRHTIDHGIVNLALMSRDENAITDLIEKLRADGHEATAMIRTAGLVATYFIDPGCEFEVISVPETFDQILGFTPATPFLPNLLS